MSNEMTAEEYLKQSKECNDSLSVFQTSVMVHYGDLRAKEAVKELHSFARSQAIEFAEWMYIYNTHYEYFKMYNGWKHKNTGHQDDVYIETSTFYSMFLAHQAKQKEGGII